jgi:hypothetical protein
MVRKESKPTPRKAASKLPDRVPEARRNFTIAEFCARNGGMSKGSYYNMKAKGLAPAESRPTGVAGGLVFISEEAEREWRIKTEALSAEVEAEGIAKREARKIAKEERKDAAAKRGEA